MLFFFFYMTLTLTLTSIIWRPSCWVVAISVILLLCLCVKAIRQVRRAQTPASSVWAERFVTSLVPAVSTTPVKSINVLFYVCSHQGDIRHTHAHTHTHTQTRTHAHSSYLRYYRTMNNQFSNWSYNISIIQNIWYIVTLSKVMRTE